MAATPQPQTYTLQQHVSYICSRLLAYGLPLLFFLVTVSFYLKTYDSAQIKITFTQIGATMLFALWVIRMLADGKLPFDKRDLLYVAPFIAFLISGMVAWVHSPFRAWAAEETSRRVFYMTIALVTIAELRGTERATRLWRWLMAAALFAVGYGFIQYLDTRFFPHDQPGLDPFIWRRAFSVRPFSTFGNPNFYGNFLVIITPLILASVLRWKGPLMRPFILLGITAGMAFFIDKARLGSFGGLDPSMSVLVGGLVVILLGLFLFYSFWKTSAAGSLPLFLILFSLLFLNLYSTETKGAWMGFTAALAVTTWLIFEYFLHFDEKIIEPKVYVPFLATLSALFAILIAVMVVAFVVPLFKGGSASGFLGFQILWIPTLIAAVIAALTMLYLTRRPWNLKKIIYGVLMFFVLCMAATVLQYAKGRLASVSFRIFTWLGTWEMVRSEPLLGNGIGTFKVIYPAHRPPEIIVLEGRSNTETDHAEDEYLEVWQDEGIIGFGIFLWLIITALTLGLKQLRWYARLRVPDAGHKRKMLDIDSDPRSYEVLGYLGAYMGALIHWGVDVSVRFVSSGIFSGLLPAALVGTARTLGRPIPTEPRLSYERWIRFGLAAFWTVVLLWLKVELVPQGLIEGGDTTQGQIIFWAVLAGAFLWAMLELLEIGNVPEEAASFDSVYPAASPRLWWGRLAAAGLLIGACGGAMGVYRDHFVADVSHNMGIFFSKESIWTKSPLYAGRMLQFPPDIRKKYEKVGGALEHYADVVRRNGAFPMAHYFTGNVYNDWGSQELQAASEARAKGNQAEAERLKNKAFELWEKAEQAYDATKSLAPNYVQTHHQVGLLYLKRADAAREWGNAAEAEKLQDAAYEEFRRYHLLDPVFPPNYDRMAQHLINRGNTAEAIELYKKALHYNNTVARTIHQYGFPERAANIAISLAKLHYNEALRQSKTPFNPPSEDVKEAIKYFDIAVKAHDGSLEAWRGLAFLLQQTGQADEAQAAFQKAQSLQPGALTPAAR